MSLASRRRIVAWTTGLLLLSGGAIADTPAPPAQHAGVEAGFTAEGHPYLGSPTATVTLEEWSDYLCPFCRRHFERTSPELIDRYVRTGKLRLVFRDFPIASLHPTSAAGHVAARCAGAQGADAYWAMHDALFARQDQWSSLADPTAFLVELAKALNLNAARVESCMRGGAAAAGIDKSIAEGESLGVTGTPAFRFRVTDAAQQYPLAGAQPIERFAVVADTLLAGKPPPEEHVPPAPELPFWAKPEGLAPDARAPGFTVAGDAFKGDPAAPLVVVEFADFECPACSKHVLEVQPAIDAELVDSGRVRWVSKQLPLRSHPHAPLAAAAAECAGEQGRYWQMHDLLFATVPEWTVADQDSRLLALAPRAGLEPRAFERCLGGRQAMERVLQDIYDAQGVIEVVPRFVILGSGPSGAVTGPLPAPQFIALLSGMLAPLAADADAKAPPPDSRR